MHNDVEMTFGEHLEELRRRVIYALLGLLVATAFCGINYRFLLSALLRPYKHAYDSMVAKQLAAEEAEEAEKSPGEATPPAPPEEGTALPSDSPLAEAVGRIEKRLAALEERLDAFAPLPKAAPGAPKNTVKYAQRFPTPRVIQGGPLTGYVTLILLCVICGIILGSPWILYQIWAFVGVGLHAHERRFVHIYGPFSFFLFIGGSATFYFVMLKYGLEALMSPTLGVMVDGVPLVDPSFFLNDYFKFVAMMTLIFGVVFQTPLIVMFLARTEIVPLDTLVRKQRIVLMILIILSAVFTPQDPVTMVMMAIPLIVLYELGLLLSWISIRRRRKQEKQEEEDEPWDEYERENEGPYREGEPDRGLSGTETQEQAPREADATADAHEETSTEDQAESYEDPYAEYQGDDEGHAEEPADDDRPEEPPEETGGPDDTGELPPEDRMK